MLKKQSLCLERAAWLSSSIYQPPWSTYYPCRWYSRAMEVVLSGNMGLGMQMIIHLAMLPGDASATVLDALELSRSRWASAAYIWLYQRSFWCRRKVTVFFNVQVLLGSLGNDTWYFLGRILPHFSVEVVGIAARNAAFHRHRCSRQKQCSWRSSSWA